MKIPSRRAVGVETQGHGRSDRKVRGREPLSPSHLNRGHRQGGIPDLFKPTNEGQLHDLQPIERTE